MRASLFEIVRGVCWCCCRGGDLAPFRLPKRSSTKHRKSSRSPPRWACTKFIVIRAGLLHVARDAVSAPSGDEVTRPSDLPDPIADRSLLTDPTKGSFRSGHHGVAQGKLRLDLTRPTIRTLLRDQQQRQGLRYNFRRLLPLSQLCKVADSKNSRNGRRTGRTRA
jgi:hypothetical protein